MILRANNPGCAILISDKNWSSIIAYEKFSADKIYWEVHISGTQTNIEDESEAIKMMEKAGG